MATVVPPTMRKASSEHVVWKRCFTADKAHGRQAPRSNEGAVRLGHGAGGLSRATTASK